MPSKSTLKNLVTIAIVAGNFLPLLSCASTPAPRPTSTKMDCKIPTFSALPESEARQGKGGVTISLAPVSFECLTEYRVSRERATPTGAELAASLFAQDSILIEEVKTPICG